MVWNHPGIGTMRFEALTSSANMVEGLAFNDWIPCDAATWIVLDRIVSQ